MPLYFSRMHTHIHKYIDFVFYTNVGLYVISAHKWLTFLLTQKKLPEDLPYYFVYFSKVGREILYKI
jgi:hypothetical protein